MTFAPTSRCSRCTPTALILRCRHIRCAAENLALWRPFCSTARTLCSIARTDAHAHTHTHTRPALSFVLGVQKRVSQLQVINRKWANVFELVWPDTGLPEGAEGPSPKPADTLK